MSSRHLVDPDLDGIIDQYPSVRLTAALLPRLRAASVATLAGITPPEFPNLAISEQHAPGLEGAPDVPVLVYQPTVAVEPVPTLLWMHGGGFVSGSARGDDVRCRRMAAALGCTIVSVDYRLAPDTPHPGPIEDCYAALRWLHANAAALGVDASRLAVGGASAGGGLAAALALLARDRGEVPLAFQLLIFPMLDDRTVVAEPPHPYAGEFMWTRDANRFGWTSLLGHEPGATDVSLYAAAARAEDLVGLPSTFISVGALDLFVDEDMEYARRLMRAGVPTELHVYPGAYHGYQIVPTAWVSQTSERDVLDALRRALTLTRVVTTGDSGAADGDA